MPVPIDYAAVLASRGAEPPDQYLADELPWLWLDEYLATTSRQTNVMRLERDTFEYIYDAYAVLEAAGSVPVDPRADSRLVAAHGRSSPSRRSRDDSRLRGWLGRLSPFVGAGWDKGHFIAHSIGGAVDGMEANVFIQRRDVNRGWFTGDKRFRAMEKYCAEHAGCYCFVRPFYEDLSGWPVAIEFGVLKDGPALVVERFSNRY